MIRLPRFACFAALACAAAIAFGPLSGCAGTAPQRAGTPSIADTAFLRDYAQTNRFRAGRPAAITITPDAKSVLFLRSGPRSFAQDLYEFDIATGNERVILTAERLLGGAEENLSPEELARRERMRQTSRGITSFQLSKDGARLLVPLSGRLFIVERNTGAFRELVSQAGYPLDARLSPDASKVACVREGDLYVIDIATGTETRLTSTATPTLRNAEAEFVAQEEMGRFEGYWWSPDSAFIAYQQTDLSAVESVFIMDPRDPAKPPASWPYPRPGKNNAVVRLGVIPSTGGATTWLNWDNALWPYLATVKWNKNAPLTVLVQNRAQTEQVLYAVDHATGSMSELLRERDDAWINLDQSMPHWLEDGSAFLWTTERTGEWTLEMRARSGSLMQQIIGPGEGFRGVANVDDARGTITAVCSTDPTQSHLWRFPLNPGTQNDRPRRLTVEAGNHSAAFGESADVFVHSASLLSGGITWTVRTHDGSARGTLTSIAERPAFSPSLELRELGGELNMRAAVIRPRNFEKGRKYPVIVSVYGGPGSNTVSATRDGYLIQQWFADHGFIVVLFDGRGTMHRGRAWERAIKNDLITIPLEDQAKALHQLARQVPEMDTDRVGVFGWSFGGYFAAMAVMQRPDVYHAGVAGAPAADWVDYDTHYTERYLGLPEENPRGYEVSNVLTHAPKLERPLLIIHGTADDNVYFVHALRMADALTRAGATYEFLPLPGFTHVVAEPEMVERMYGRIMEFFVRELGR